MILERYGGIATRAQLIGSGIPPDTLTSAVRAEQLVRVRRAHYATIDADQQAVSAVRVGGRLTAGSAAQSYGLWGSADGTLHVRLPTNAARLRPATAPGHVRLHWVDGVHSSFCWRDSLEEALVSSVRWEPDETAIAILDTALGCGLINTPKLTTLLAHEGSRARRLARAARPGSESGIESLARQRLERSGRIVEQQVPIPGVGRVDMRVDGSLLVEFDGFAAHSSKSAFERDRERDADARLRGVPVVRFTARRVLNDWASVADTIDTLLQRQAA